MKLNVRKIIYSSLKKLLEWLFSEENRYKIYRLLGKTIKRFLITEHNMFFHITLLKNKGFSPNLILDIGAYKGEWTLNVIDIFPKANFVLFEAQPSKSQHLQYICDQHKNIDFHNCLLGGEHKANVPFYEMETGSSIYNENTEFERNVHNITMQRLDDLIAETGDNSNVFLKLDVQGAEIDVLKGASKVLGKVECFIAEVSTINYNEGAPLMSEVIEYSKSVGFVIYDICDQRRNKEGVLFQVDLIFIRENSQLRNIKFY